MELRSTFLRIDLFKTFFNLSFFLFLNPSRRGWKITAELNLISIQYKKKGNFGHFFPPPLLRHYCEEKKTPGEMNERVRKREKFFFLKTKNTGFIFASSDFLRPGTFCETLTGSFKHIVFKILTYVGVCSVKTEYIYKLSSSWRMEIGETYISDDISDDMILGTLN